MNFAFRAKVSRSSEIFVVTVNRADKVRGKEANQIVVNTLSIVTPTHLFT